MPTQLRIQSPMVYDAPLPRAVNKASLRQRIVLLVAALVLSGAAFFLIVAYQRDARIRQEGLDWAGRVQASLQTYYSARGFLPTTLPKVEPVPSAPLAMSYPTPEQLARLNDVTEPVIVVAGGRVGLVLPGDGCPSVVLENHKLQVRWLTVAEVLAARARRNELLGEPVPTSH